MSRFEARRELLSGLYGERLEAVRQALARLDELVREVHERMEKEALPFPGLSQSAEDLAELLQAFIREKSKHGNRA